MEHFFTAFLFLSLGFAVRSWLPVKRGQTAGISHLPDVINSLDAGYYFEDVVLNKSFLSVRLREMLGLAADKPDILLTITEKLGEAQTESIQHAIANLHKQINTLVVINLENNRQYECLVSGKYTQENTLIGIILWLRDTTSIGKLHERMNRENKQLKQEVRQFSTILNSLSFPIWLRNSDLSIRYCNLAYSIAAEEDAGDSTGTPELHPHLRQVAASSLESNEVKSERRHIVIEGERKFYHFTDTPLKPDNVIVGVAHDITDLEKTQEELQRYVSLQSELLESVNSAMAVFGSDTRLKSFNYAYVRLWELDEVWLDTHPSYSEIIEVLREKRKLPEQANFLQFKQQHLKMFTDLIESREEIFYLPDGRTLRVLAIPHALGGILFAYEDVTDRLALERSYNTLIAVQKATLDNLHEGVVVFGEDGRLRLYNPRFIALWKLEKAVLSPETHISDIVEKTRHLHYSEDWEAYKVSFLATLLTRQVQQKRIERTDGTLIDSIVVPLPDGANLVTFYDITDSILVERTLRERNEALSEADRLKTEFLANVSYELRSPLTSITGFSEMLTGSYFGELLPRQQEYVSAIHQSAQHLMSLINDILDIASIEAGYMKLNISQFDIYAMLKSVIALVSERMRENNLKFIFNCPLSIGMLEADEIRIKQIIFNLLSNSIKYSNPGGFITLNVSLYTLNTLPELLIIVEDNGIGISPEEHNEVFDKFRKGKNASHYKSGAGLGLSMVKSFTQLHGGSVELSSIPKTGTKITCRLPLQHAKIEVPLK